jgi:hypothetical protein
MLITFSGRAEVVPVTFTPSRRERLNFGPAYLAISAAPARYHAASMHCTLQGVNLERRGGTAATTGH